MLRDLYLIFDFLKSFKIKGKPWPWLKLLCPIVLITFFILAILIILIILIIFVSLLLLVSLVLLDLLKIWKKYGLLWPSLTQWQLEIKRFLVHLKRKLMNNIGYSSLALLVVPNRYKKEKMDNFLILYFPALLNVSHASPVCHFTLRRPVPFHKGEPIHGSLDNIKKMSNFWFCFVFFNNQIPFSGNRAWPPSFA